MSMHLVITKKNKDFIEEKQRTIEDLGPELAEKKFREE